MKTVRKFVPMAFFALAIIGAFSSNAMNRSAKATNFTGYIRNGLGTVCEASIQCSDLPGPACMVGTTQLWGKDSSGKCVVELHRIP